MSCRRRPLPEPAETARHAGHMDALRELADGRKGHY
ncbi:DUF664 domain-containing protein [Streptomyces sp. NPDC047049]